MRRMVRVEAIPYEAMKQNMRWGGAHTQFLSMGKYPTVLLSKLVRDDKVMTLEEAHWRLSHMSAAAIGLEGVGTLRKGMAADVVVYDFENDECTGKLPGRVLRTSAAYQ